MSELLAEGSVDSVPRAEVVASSFVPWRLTHTQRSVYEEAQILLGARFRVGNEVVHVHHEWQGTVYGMWVEADGTIWMAVECKYGGRQSGMNRYEAREDCLLAARQPVGPLRS
ncbi:MAG: hypothetical protein ABIG34_03600 [Candidatus Peregrinibacteria bacterium]